MKSMQPRVMPYPTIRNPFSTPSWPSTSSWLPFITRVRSCRISSSPISCGTDGDLHLNSDKYRMLAVTYRLQPSAKAGPVAPPPIATLTQPNISREW